MSEYTLMMQNEKVLQFESSNGLIANKITWETNNVSHLPFALKIENSVKQLNSWLTKRCLPINITNNPEIATREEIEVFFEITQLKKEDIPLLNFRASLFDPFWINPPNGKGSWEKVNFFTRQYSKDIGDIFFTPWKVNKKKINYDSPDFTTGGLLKKCWRQDSNLTSYLIKAGSKATQQEPLNEILASVFLEKTKILPFVRYDYHVEGIDLCSKCKNFMTSDSELISAAYIYATEPRPEGKKVDTHLKDMCERYSIKDASEYIDKLHFVDAITVNPDRNLGNIGFIRNIITNEIIPAPAHDFAACFWNNSAKNPEEVSSRFKEEELLALKKYRDYLTTEEIIKSIEECIISYPLLNKESKLEFINAYKERNRILFHEKPLIQNPITHNSKETSLER